MTSCLQFLKDLYQKLDKPLTLLEFEEIAKEAKNNPFDGKNLSKEEKEWEWNVAIPGFFLKKLSVYKVIISLWDEEKLSPK